MSERVEGLKELGSSIWQRIKRMFVGVDEYIDDRLKSPFVWSYITAWMLLNWKIPAKLIFEFESVNVVWLSAQIENIPMRGYLVPLVFSVSYVIFIRPILAALAGLGKYLMGSAQKLNNHIMKNQPISHEVLAKEKRKVRTLLESKSLESIELDELRDKYSSLKDLYG